MADKIKFITGTKANYQALASKEEYALYFLTDSQELYKGSSLIADATDSDLNNIIVKDTYSNWLAKQEEYIPSAGLICIVEDRTKVNGVVSPDIKIGDGSTKFKDLAYLTDKIVSDAMTECGISIKNGNKYFNGIAARVEHTLTIGPHVYDGSADVTIPVYSGE